MSSKEALSLKVSLQIQEETTHNMLALGAVIALRHLRKHMDTHSNTVPSTQVTIDTLVRELCETS